MTLLQGAREHQVIADIDFEAVTRALLGGLLTYAITGLVPSEDAALPSPANADAIVEVVMRAVMPR
jgi:hypothetical protein